jgi:hypothetical protein
MTPSYEALLCFATSLFDDYEVAMDIVASRAVYSDQDIQDVAREVADYRAKLKALTDAWDKR